MNRIGFIRHGITLWNLERRAQGQTDIPLHEIGRRQAIAMANRLTNESWDYIYASDLSRAKETAEIIATAKGLELRTDNRLREMFKGETEGTTLEDRIQKWGIDWEKQQLGIEDNQSIISRGLSFINEITKDIEGKNILIVSHGAVIELTLRSLVPNFHFEGPIDNTSITIISNDKYEWKCELFNCSKHLV